MKPTLTSPNLSVAAALTSVTLLLTLGGCVDPDEIDELDSVESELGLLTTLDHSILKEYQKARATPTSTAISYPICIYSNFTTAITAAKRESYRALMQRVVNRWNDALETQIGWTIRDITLYQVGTATSCPDTHAGKRVYKVFGNKDLARGSATYWEFLNTAGGAVPAGGTVSEFGEERYIRELHEYGHQIGMADTYEEAGKQLPFDQPPGVMNNYNAIPVSDLTDDDLASVRHVWARVSGRTTAQCPDGYVVGSSSPNVYNNRFCVLPRYDFTSKWLGTSKCIGILGNQLQLQTCSAPSSSAAAAQEWRLIPTDSLGYYRIKNRSLGYEACLDIIADGVNDKVRMSPCTNISGQFWRLAPTSDPTYYQLKSMWLGTGKCLGIINDGVNDKVRMETCANVSGQMWRRRQH
ncbi:MAG: ricin-type beta-trefoil lectin domain protein [Myxococcales bacterium]|nr:ricin-type beta-trefoil lectin domain protein [Myxococcales bacterium]